MVFCKITRFTLFGGGENEGVPVGGQFVLDMVTTVVEGMEADTGTIGNSGCVEAEQRHRTIFQIGTGDIGVFVDQIEEDISKKVLQIIPDLVGILHRHVFLGEDFNLTLFKVSLPTTVSKLFPIECNALLLDGKMGWNRNVVLLCEAKASVIAS